MANAKTSLTRRTLHYYWKVTRRHKALFAALMVSTFAFVALLSYGNPYVMSLIVDQVSAQPVEADQVFTVFGPYIVALILINVFGQAASKLQDYTMYKLEIAASYDLATMSFDRSEERRVGKAIRVCRFIRIDSVARSLAKPRSL